MNTTHWKKEITRSFSMLIRTRGKEHHSLLTDSVCAVMSFCQDALLLPIFSYCIEGKLSQNATIVF